MDKVLPVVNAEGSDSAMLDNTLEFLMMNGMPLPLAVMMCIPEPWSNDETMSREKRDFYHYYATMMEPWDGPAAILFSDGDMVGAVLDRNGLRPSRYYITDGRAADPRPPRWGCWISRRRRSCKKSRLQPRQDAAGGHWCRAGIIGDDELKEAYARQPALRRMAGPESGAPAGAAHPQQAGGEPHPGAAGPAVQGLRLHL